MSGLFFFAEFWYFIFDFRKEYDIVPHLDSANHQELQEVGDAFALCTCLTSDRLWLALYREALKSNDIPPIGVVTAN